MVLAVRARFGTQFDLMVSCNQGWRMSWDAHPSWSLSDAAEVARDFENVQMVGRLHRSVRNGLWDAQLLEPPCNSRK